MTNRTTDIHCDKCGRYMHSLQPLERIPATNICDQCRPSPLGTLAPLLDGGWIERYHIKGQRMLTRQSVAEHSWRIVAILFAVYKDAPGDVCLTASLLLAAAFHDVSERVTGDIPANVKRHNPAIEQAVREVSTAEEDRLGIRFSLSEDQRKLLAWADRYEGALHCWDEYQLGNRLIVTTFLRYYDYCQNPKYELADKNLEHNRHALMTELSNYVDRMHKHEI